MEQAERYQQEINENIKRFRRGAIHNIKIDIIPDGQDPLKNPQAEAARLAERGVSTQ